MNLPPAIVDRLAEVLWHRQAIRLLGHPLSGSWHELDLPARESFCDDATAVLRVFEHEGLALVPQAALRELADGTWAIDTTARPEEADDAPDNVLAFARQVADKAATISNGHPLSVFPGLVDEVMAASKGLVEKWATDADGDRATGAGTNIRAAMKRAITGSDEESTDDNPLPEGFDPFKDLDSFEVSDQEKWHTWVTQNTDAYGRAAIKYAARWARISEDKLYSVDIDLSQLSNTDEVVNGIIRDNLQAASNEADTEGITGFMHGAAVAALVDSWRWGEVLRRWHNKEWGAEDTEGVVNPAVLTIGLPE